MYMYVHILIHLYIYSISSIPLENLDFCLSRGIKKGSEVSEVFFYSQSCIPMMFFSSKATSPQTHHRMPPTRNQSIQIL